MKLIFVVVLVGLLALAGGAAYYYDLLPIPDKNTPSAKPMGTGVEPQRDVIVALGRLKPADEIINIGVPMGERLAELKVKEGDQVKPGQELAVLTSYPDRLADRDLARARLQEAEQQLQAALVSAKAAVTEAEVGLAQAEKIGPLDIDAQQAKVRLINAQLATAKKELERITGLKLDSIPGQQIDRQKLAVRQATEELSAAQAQLAQLEQAQPLKVEAARAKLASAKASIERIRAEIPVASLKAGLALAEARLRHSLIRAPAAGRILKILSRPGEPLGAKPILQMANTEQMIAVAEVYETEVQYLAVGAKATVSSRALPEEIKGTVERIGRLVDRNSLFALDPTAAADHRVIEVTIRLDDSKLASRFLNLQVKVSIAAKGAGQPTTAGGE